MRVLLTLLFAIAISTASTAQGAAAASSSAAFINPGGLFFGGSLKFTGTSEKHSDSGGSINGPKTTNFAILPQTAYILNRMLALGIAIGYVNSVTKTIEDVSTETFELKDSKGEFVIQPQLAYYVNVMSRFYIFATLYVGMGFGNATNQTVQYNDETQQFEVVSYKDKLNSFRVGIALGFAYFVAAQWALTLSYGDLYYGTTTQKDSEDSDQKWTTTNYGLDLTLATLQVGILFYLAGGGK